MKAYKTNTYLIGNKGISKKISSPLLLLTCALTLAACGGGGSGGGSNPGKTILLDLSGIIDFGLIRHCDFNPTARYNITDNNFLSINEDSEAECNFRLPISREITSTTPSNLAVNITIFGTSSIFPAGSITYDGSDATANPIPLEGTDGGLITNINLTLNPADDTFGDEILIFTTYNSRTNKILYVLSYPIDIIPVDDAPIFPNAPYSFTTIAVGFKGKILGRVEATIPADNPNKVTPIYAFAADNGAADDNFTIDASTGVIALKRSLVLIDAGDYIFNVTAQQAGTAGEDQAKVNITILSIGGDEDGDGFDNAYDADPVVGTINVTGTGTPTDPYIISNIYQLQAIDGTDNTETDLDDENSATSGSWLYGANRAAQLGSSYKLSNDIDAAVTRNWNDGAGFNPIGDCSTVACIASSPNIFKGVFNGTGFAVHNLFINRTGYSMGFFDGVTAATIINFGLENADIIYRSGNAGNVGALIGIMFLGNNVNHVYATGSVRVRGGGSLCYVGGLIGHAGPDVSNSYTVVNLEGNGIKGGLVGKTDTTRLINLVNLYSFNRVNGTNSRQNGGLYGRNIANTEIFSSYAVSNATGTEQVFGLVGDSLTGTVTIKSSYWDNQTGNQNIDGSGTPTISLSMGLRTRQLQNCGLNGDTGICVGLFPSVDPNDASNILWGEQPEDNNGVTTYWDFDDADEYPYLLATDSEGRNLLPTVAEQRCQRDRFFYDRPCAEE